MVCKSFICKTCSDRKGKTVRIRVRGGLQHSIRTHYWDKHRPTMMEGVKKRTKKRK